MMQARPVKRLAAAFLVALFCASAAAHAAVYKWTDADGSVTYSDVPPNEADKVRDASRSEPSSVVPAPPRSAEVAGTKDKASAGSATVAPVISSLQAGTPMRAGPSLDKPEPAPPHSEATAGRGEPALRKPHIALSKADPVADAARPDAAAFPPEGSSFKSETDSAPRTTARGYREAARDPCLRSSDPSCYERNKDRYHPYLGYAPGATQSAAVSFGATSSVAASGFVGGASEVPRSNVSPGRVESPLIFFDPPPKKRRGR